MEISKIDHIVLTVKDIDKTSEFYSTVLGMSIENFGENRTALKFGRQRINLHESGKEFEPKAENPTPGSADLCFLVTGDLDGAMAHVKKYGVEIIAGPNERAGANGPLRSFYFRDPDLNLIEIANEG
jgi:catechol 2,3-dioxygenase-like lactoylglutathione lyase family enzyme